MTGIADRANNGDRGTEVPVASQVSSAVSLRGILNSATSLGAGEVAGGLAFLVLNAYVARVYGASLLGVVALAQTVVMYVTMGTDQGLTLIGARIVAGNPSAALDILRPVLLKRLILCAGTVSIGIAYALWGPIPNDARLYVLGFVLAVIPYALSLDWIAWGLNHMGWLGARRALERVGFVVAAIGGMYWTGGTLVPLVASRIWFMAGGTVLLWLLWRFAWRPQIASGGKTPPSLASNELSWGTIFTLGGATIFNLLFNNVDTLILAGMTTASEVGCYNAAYKILFLIFAIYYLVGRSFYPHLAASNDPEGLRKWLFLALPVVAIGGSALAAVIWIFSRQILTLLYGSTLGSVGLLRILVISLPMDFCTGLVGILLVSRRRDRLNLVATSLAATLNVGLNFLLIPRMQARGAAWATVLSYAFLLSIFIVSISRRGSLGTVDNPSVGNREMAMES